MYVIIFAGKRENRLHECRIGIFAEQISEVGDDDHFEKIPVKEEDIQMVQLVFFKGRQFPHSRDSLPKIPSRQKSWWTLSGR